MRGIYALISAVALAGSVHAATIADFGGTAPTPGVNDVSQFSGGNNRDGLNYYADNATPPGQTFTTGSNPSGYGLNAIYVKTGGYDANNTGTAQTYTLRIYSVSGSTATLISTYVTDNVLGFTDGVWLKYAGLTNILSPNTTYAYTHRRNTVGWDGMGCATGNPYAGGEICLIPTAGGAITFGPTHNSDAAFMANLLPITDPFVFGTAITPASAVAGTSVLITAGVGSGTQPIKYQWLFTGTNGITSIIPNATNISYTIASVQTTNQGSYSLSVSNGPGGLSTNTAATLTVRAAYTISDIGGAPTTGTYDIAQMTAGTDLDGLNYFSDNATPPGQTFTTGANGDGYTLTAIYLKTAGVNSSATGTPKTYTLRLYSISGSTATLISTYLTDNTLGFGDGNWLRYTGMTNILQPNTTYAYTHRQNGAGWDQISAVTNNLYAGGEACLVPQAGGAVVFGPNHTLDAAFQVSMVPNGFPAIQNVGISPVNWVANPVYVPTPVTLTVQASGTAPLHYQWQTDNGLGGAFSDIPSSNTNAYAIDTTGMSAGTYLYQVIVTNGAVGAPPSTSSVVTLNLSGPSAPVLATDIAITPSAVFVGENVQLSATFQGSPTIKYQWMFDNGGGPAAISGATNSTYSIPSAQLVNNGAYYLTATNTVAPYSTSSSSGTLLVASPAQANTTGAGIFDFGSIDPTPGPNDIAQLIFGAAPNPAGLNYYVDNGTPPGETFTTGATTNRLSTLYLREESGSTGGAITNAQTYTLRIYQVFAGTNAALLTSYVSTNTFVPTDGNWIQWTGLTNVLWPSNNYAFSLARNGSGWWKVATDAGVDGYPNGQVASLPVTIGPIFFSTVPSYDATFMLGLTPFTPSPVATNPTNITSSVSGGSLNLSWPSDHLGWFLQTQTNSSSVGLKTNWFDVPGSSALTNTSITMDKTSPTVFFRLRSP